LGGTARLKWDLVFSGILGDRPLVINLVFGGIPVETAVLSKRGDRDSSAKPCQANRFTIISANDFRE